MTDVLAVGRPALVRRGLWLNYLTLGYNAVEAVVSLAAGVVAGSVALVGFGVDSVIEVMASAAAQWRLRADLDPDRRVRVELVTRRAIGVSLLTLALYVGIDSTLTLLAREAPERSLLGCLILGLSLVVMPLLARGKRKVAHALGSRALDAEATQTSVCAWLSAIALAGVGLNAAAGWWWADPAAALAMTPVIVWEGLAALRGQAACGECCDSSSR
jgi:divalent metal cation (Fe/Co/Zn/Cd) transporter